MTIEVQVDEVDGIAVAEADAAVAFLSSCWPVVVASAVVAPVVPMMESDVSVAHLGRKLADGKKNSLKTAV